MKNYELEDSEQMEQVWDLYVGTGFYIQEQLIFQHKIFLPFFCY